MAALVGQGRRILDCCAAPGGKTAAMATHLPEAEIVATELHPHRATLLRRLAPQQNVEVVTADALALPYGADFDRVLVDVPCSGTGTLARNPEIKWKLKPEDLLDLQTRQIAILKASMRHVSPGGRLVYSTCSLEPEENEQVITACLSANFDFKIVPVRAELQRLRNRESWSGKILISCSAAIFFGPFLVFILAMDSLLLSEKALTTKDTKEHKVAVCAFEPAGELPSREGTRSVPYDRSNAASICEFFHLSAARASLRCESKSKHPEVANSHSTASGILSITSSGNPFVFLCVLCG